MGETPRWYTIRINGRLGPTALSAFPELRATFRNGETVLTGFLQDRSALFGVLGQMEALGLDLLELRPIRTTPHVPLDYRQRPLDGAN
jgi:hypothetical protein